MGSAPTLKGTPALDDSLPSESFSLVLTGGEVVSPVGTTPLDIGVRNGRIAALEPAGSLRQKASTDRTFDINGLHVLPGVIDSHVHFREPGKEDREDIESGSRGAVLGGVTCFFDMPNTISSVTSKQSLEGKLTRAKGRAWCDYAFYVGADGQNTDDLGHLENLPGVCGVKVFMSSSTTDLMVTDNSALDRIFRSGAKIISLHAEDDDRIQARRHIAEQAKDVSVHGIWRDVQSALLATQRVVELARATRRKVHILHVSTEQELDLISQNREFVSCEVLPQHLTFHAPDCYAFLGSKAQQNPPIRDEIYQRALWRGVASGVVDVIASDHGPHSLTDKALPYPNMSAGMPGTQTLVPIMLNYVTEGKLSLARLADLFCRAPARVFGIRGKGQISIGFDADFTIVDMRKERTISDEWIASKVGWTAYDGMRTVGWPIGTIVRGHVVMWENSLLGIPMGCPARFSSPSADNGALTQISERKRLQF